MTAAGEPSLRVLHVITTLDRGGAEKALLHLVDAPLQGRVTHSVAYIKGPGELALEFAGAGTPVHALGAGTLGQAGAYGRARHLVRETRPDVVHTHLFKADCLGAALCGPREGRTGARLVSTKHNEDVYLAGDGPKPRALRAVARWAAGHADALVAITPGVRTFSAGTLGDAARGMRVIPYGLPVPAAGDGASFRHALDIADDAPLVACLARFAPQKDHVTLLRAFADVPGDARLVLLGRGPLQNEIRAQAAGDPRVIVAGFVHDPRHALSAADVVVLASRHEGLGLVVLEAAQHGVPVVATRVGGIPDVVADGETGLLVPAGDAAALTAALARVLANPALRGRLGAAARERVLREHDVATYVRRHAALYAEITERTR